MKIVIAVVCYFILTGIAGKKLFKNNVLEEEK